MYMEIQRFWKKDPKCLLEKIKIGEFPLTLIIKLSNCGMNSGNEIDESVSTKARQQREMNIGTQLASFYSV